MADKQAAPRPPWPAWRVVLGYLHLGFAFFIFLTVMVILLPLMVLPVAVLGQAGQGVSHLGLRLWAACFYLFGVGYRIRGRQYVPAKGGCLVVANHSSFLDSPALYAAMPRTFRPLGKVEMARLPVFGLIYRHVVIQVDRGQLSSRAASLGAIRRELAAGRVVVVFAEGSMAPIPGMHIRPLQTGALSIAAELGLPIVPLGISGSGYALPPGIPMRLRPGIVRLNFGPAQPVDLDIRTFAQHLQGVLQDLVA